MRDYFDLLREIDMAENGNADHNGTGTEHFSENEMVPDMDDETGMENNVRGTAKEDQGKRSWPGCAGPCTVCGTGEHKAAECQGMGGPDCRGLQETACHPGSCTGATGLHQGRSGGTWKFRGKMDRKHLRTATMG